MSKLIIHFVSRRIEALDLDPSLTCRADEDESIEAKGTTSGYRTERLTHHSFIIISENSFV